LREERKKNHQLSAFCVKLKKKFDHIKNPDHLSSSDDSDEDDKK
jgi:hypothetical protein